MSNQLIVTPEACQDLADAFAWYERRKAGLGSHFFRCVDACMELIRYDPLAFAEVYKGFRRAKVKRFPYMIFFDVSNQQVSVYCVFHTARDPAKWRRRLR